MYYTALHGPTENFGLLIGSEVNKWLQEKETKIRKKGRHGRDPRPPRSQRFQTIADMLANFKLDRVGHVDNGPSIN